MFLISLISSDLNPPWEVAAMIADIRRLSLMLRIWWHFIPRSCNLMAHWVAKQSINGYLPVNWVASLLEELS